MKNEIINYNETIFENIKHIDDEGVEFWYARELMKVLGYSEYRKFMPVIKKTIAACQVSNYIIDDHFDHVAGMVNIG